MTLRYSILKAAAEVVDGDLPWAWYDMSQETGFSDTDSIGILTDFGDHGCDVVQATPAKKPQYLTNANGHGIAALFDGADDCIICTGLDDPYFADTSNPYTLILVQESVGHASTKTFVTMNPTGDNNNYLALQSTSSELPRSFRRAATTTVYLQNGTSSHGLGTPIVETHRYTPAEAVNDIGIRVNNGSMVFGTNSSSGNWPTNLGSITLGCLNTTAEVSHFNTWFKELRIYKEALDDTAIQATHDELYTKWSITP